jgi:hypothetical protein
LQDVEFGEEIERLEDKADVLVAHFREAIRTGPTDVECHPDASWPVVGISRQPRRCMRVDFPAATRSDDRGILALLDI